MSCFGGRVTPDLYQNCCNANTLCEFVGDISSLVTEPIYVQKVFDAVLFNLQGMRSVDTVSYTHLLDIIVSRFPITKSPSLKISFAYLKVWLKSKKP